MPAVTGYVLAWAYRSMACGSCTAERGGVVTSTVHTRRLSALHSRYSQYTEQFRTLHGLCVILIHPVNIQPMVRCVPWTLNRVDS